MAAKFTKAYLKELAYKWEKGTLTEEERANFEQWYLDHDDETAELPANYDGEDVIRDRLFSRLEDHMNISRLVTGRGKGFRTRWIAAASILLVLFGIGAYTYVKNTVDDKQQAVMAGNDINPGGNKAILTLANGQEINLDGATDGELAEEGGVKVSKTADGQIIYKLASNHHPNQGTSEEIAYNTIRTPKGGQYKIILPDSSCVWLNAASFLKYPTNFGENNRTVELNGEAYFEISPDKHRPFLVKSSGQLTKVLGTQFNISAYSDEDVVKTTLVQGAVSVTQSSEGGNERNSKPTVLLPGEQSTMRKGKTSVAKVDINQYIGWKRGVFYFDETKLTDAMKQLSRWYDVEVVYESEVPDTYFYGEINRNKTLLTALAILQEGGVSFKIEKEGDKNRLLVY